MWLFHLEVHVARSASSCGNGRCFVTKYGITHRANGALPQEVRPLPLGLPSRDSLVSVWGGGALWVWLEGECPQDLTTRRSCSEYYAKRNRGGVSHWSKTQAIVALSSGGVGQS